MKFLKTVSLPNAAGVSRAHWTPDAAQFARLNKFKGACMFRLTQLFFQFRRSIGRNAYFEASSPAFAVNSLMGCALHSGCRAFLELFLEFVA